MSDRENGHNREDIVLDLTKTAGMRVALFGTLASIATVLVSQPESIFLWQTPAFLAIATIAAWLEKDCAIWLERRRKQEILSRQDFKWRKRWEKNVLQFYRISIGSFALSILYLLPVLIRANPA